MAEKYLNYSGTDLLWKKLIKLLEKKIDNIESFDDSITVTDKNKLSVNISVSEDNLLKLIPGEGLFAQAPSKMHKLTFGAGGEFVYDGSEDVTVPVYDGTHNIN